MTGRHIGGPAAHKAAVRRAKKAEELAGRRATAWKLFVQEGLTYDKIGARLGVSNKTAWEDVYHVYRLVQNSPLMDADVIRVRQQALIDQVTAAHIKKRGNVSSAKIVLDALNREARLHGIDKQAAAGYTVEQVLFLMRGVLELFIDVVPDRTLRTRFTDGLRRKLGPLAQTLDVTPPPAPRVGAALTTREAIQTSETSGADA